VHRIGDVVASRFELVRKVGAGSMGTVFAAKDLHGGATVALKLVARRPAGPTSPADGAERRFDREADTLARLVHPAIVRFVDRGVTADGDAWLAMEWVDGETLASRLERGPLAPADAVAVALRVADALGAAHALGVVHRDVKPANVMLPDGDLAQAKLVDFGVARGTASRTILTVPGTLVGTASYASPEQARGEADVDARSDVWALGCLLFRCIAGRSPFGSTDTMAVLAKILFERAPRLRDEVPDVPPALDALCAAMLERDRRGRPADGSAVAVMLHALTASDLQDAGAPTGSLPRATPPAS
jgi:serine/threonine protein kinase